MDKYAQLNRFHHNRQLQVYMYALMYVDTETMPVEEHFTSQSNVCEPQENVNSRSSTKILAWILLQMFRRL